MTEDLDTTPDIDVDDLDTDLDLDVDLSDYVPLTVEEVLASARRVERTASICLRADLQGEWDRLAEELSTLITPTGELLDTSDDESSIGSKSPRGRVEEISARMTALRREMKASMWHVTFRGMDSDALTLFQKRHAPKDKNGNRTDFFNRLVAETAISPEITMDGIKALRKKLGASAIGTLIKTAHEASSEGGVDVPKLPLSLRRIAEGSYED